MDSRRDRDGRTDPPRAFCYVTTHQHSRAILGAMSQGAGAPMVGPGALQPFGDVIVYGRLRGCDRIIREADQAGRDWLYIDRGYLRASRDTDYSGYFRATWNHLQGDGTGAPNFVRLRALGVTIRPWRADGHHILVCPPGDVYAGLSGFDAAGWRDEVTAKLAQHSDRPVRVREKPRDGARNVPLAQDLIDCWAVVAHSSNVAVDALLLGVPVFVTDRCGARRCAETDLSRIESPRLGDDREAWAATLAAQQWTLEEMRSGLAWRELQEQRGA